MANKMRRLLVLLLIILEESGPTAARSSSCSLSRCNCANQGLNSVPQFLPINITYLFLYGNEITTLRQYDFARYKALERLDLGYNQISAISSKAFYNATTVRKIELYGNQLTSLRVNMFEGLENLEILDLHHNGMTSIEAGTFSSTPKLHTLSLRSNRLSTIAADTFSNLPQFSSLDLSYNSISTIEADVFVNLPQFLSLDLADNRMNTFPVGLFSNLSTLSNLEMKNNHMEALPIMAYDILASISTSSIGTNPWQCDCRMLPFKQKMTGSYLFEYTITCAGPGSFQGKSLLQDVNPQDLICAETTASPSKSTLSVIQPGDSTKFRTQSTTHSTVSTPGLSTVSTHVQPKMTESSAGPSLFSLPVFLSGLLGAAVLLVGLLVICAILFTIRYIYKQKTREAPSSQDSTVSFTNTNLTAAVTVGGQVQTGQDRSSIATSTEGYSDVIPSQPGLRQHLYSTDEQGYQILPPATGAGSLAGYQNVSADAHGADADASHQYEALSLRR